MTLSYPHLCTVSSSVYSGSLLSTYSCGIRILSAMEYGVRHFSCSFYCHLASSFTEHWICGMEFQKLFLSFVPRLISSFRARVACSARVVSHKLNALHTESPLAADGQSVMKHTVNNQCPSHFQVPAKLRWFPLFSLSVLLVLTLVPRGRVAT